MGGATRVRTSKKSGKLSYIAFESLEYSVHTRLEILLAIASFALS